ncbi:MAG: aminotransferase class V-fold PLP-dependent enzyme, partial [Bdellovibrionales bacterium]|nr:aminotransferase class V-fold PLP-dependent enzyme [Bdellovibrionales bacterium]
QEGQTLRAALDEVRSSVFETFRISESSHSVIFTSGATEANNTALLSLYDSALSHPNVNLVTTSVEHPSVRSAIALLQERHGLEIREVAPIKHSSDISSEKAGCDCSCAFDKDFQCRVLKAIDDNTRAVSLMWVNNETGQIFPVPELANRIADAHPNVYLHVDAVQAVGKIPVDLSRFSFDSLSISPHKFGGLPGVGILIIRNRVPHAPLIVGGAQESYWRAGTENVFGILTLPPLLNALSGHIDEYCERIALLRNEFEENIIKRFPSITPLAQNFLRVANTSFLHIPGQRADDLVVALDLEGVACSVGAACSSGKMLGSHVALNMGLSEQASHEVLRFSFRTDFPRSDLPLLLARCTTVLERAATVSHSSTHFETVRQ